MLSGAFLKQSVFQQSAVYASALREVYAALVEQRKAELQTLVDLTEGFTFLKQLQRHAKNEFGEVRGKFLQSLRFERFGKGACLTSPCTLSH